MTLVENPKRRIAPACAVLLGVLLAGSATAASPTTKTVMLDKFAFSPKEITIAPGATIVWINNDQTPHTVLARDKSFGSTGLDTGDSYSYTFTKAGDFSYFCSMHPFMTGIVHVRK